MAAAKIDSFEILRFKILNSQMGTPCSYRLMGNPDYNLDP